MPRAKVAAGAAKKPRATKGHKLAEKFPNGETLRDLCKKDWKLGDVIGQGGFGLIYLASDKDTSKVGAQYVVKIEPISNGPLFCELHFYQRVAKPDMIGDWVKTNKLKYLGVPKYIASGQHIFKGNNYRFMVMERFSTDLQLVFEGAGKTFSKQTVYSLALRLLDSLEYLHENGYIHADIKASNCLLGYKSGKPDVDSVYLVDFGLAAKYNPDGRHREYKEDPRKVHDGTIEFTSIDAHKGVNPSRRGDMEILGYCLLQWLCSKLPWEDKLDNKEYVRDSKIRYMNDIPGLMKKCFPQGNASDEVTTFLSAVNKMQYEEKPNYNKLRDIFQKGLTKLGVKDMWKLALPVAGAAKSASPKKGVKRKSTDAGMEETKSKLKAKVASPRPATPKAKVAPLRPATPKAKVATPKTQSRPATPKTKVTPKTKTAVVKPSQKATSASRVKSPAAAKQRVQSPSTSKQRVQSPLAVNYKANPLNAKARVIGKKAANGSIGSPVTSPMSNGGKKGRPMSPKAESPAPKKRKVMRRKNIQMCEMSVQTSPGLKQNR